MLAAEAPTPRGASAGEHQPAAPAQRGNLRAWMNPTLLAVAQEATHEEVGDLMARERIHRECVVAGQRLERILSSLDVVESRPIQMLG